MLVPAWKIAYYTTVFIVAVFISCGSDRMYLLWNSTTTAIIVPFIILCAFPFLSRIITLPQLCLFFPDQLLEVYVDMKESGLVNLGGKVTTVAAFIIPLYTVICLILQPILYRSYSKAEVK